MKNSQKINIISSFYILKKYFSYKRSKFFKKLNKVSWPNWLRRRTFEPMIVGSNPIETLIFFNSNLCWVANIYKK